MNVERFHGRAALQQRVLPAYRAAFFDALASACAGGLSIFAGKPLPEEHIATSENLQTADYSPGKNWHFSHPGSPFYQCWQSGLISWLEEWQPQKLIVEANPRYASTRLAIRWMHTRNRPVLGWGLGAPLLGGPLQAWRSHSRWKFLSLLDGLIAYSQRGADEYRALGIPAERVFVASNAVAPRPEQPLPERPDDFTGRPKLLFVGRLQARKRIDHLLYACARLPESIQPELWIAGDGPARQELQNLAQKVYPNAEFYGERRGPELRAIFVAADLFVLPGTGGLAVQEAMSYGLPVIVAQGDGTQDDLVKERNGWTIPPDDLPALVETLEAALSDPKRLRRMGAASYRIVAEEVNLEKMVEVFVMALSTVTV
jgi:glycosyltransferase involved in cell wall biosynthesis